MEWKLPTDRNKLLLKPIITPSRNGGRILASKKCLHPWDCDRNSHWTILDILSILQNNCIQFGVIYYAKLCKGTGNAQFNFSDCENPTGPNYNH